MDIVLLLPGQGSQKAGMGKELAAAFPSASTVFQEADDTLGFSKIDLKTGHYVLSSFSTSFTRF